MFKKNLYILVTFLMIVAGLTVSAVALRQWQQERIKANALKIGLKSYQNGQWELAAGKLGRYLRFDPVDSNILFKYADAHLRIRPLQISNIQQAIAAYRTIIRVDKKNKTAVSELLSLYLQIDVPAEAELVAGRFLQNTNDTDIKTLLAISLARQRKYQQAADLLEQVIKEQPSKIDAYEAMSMLVSKNPQGRYNTPEYWLNLSVQNNQLSAQAVISRAAYYLEKNKLSAAVSNLDKAEQLDLSLPAERIKLANQYIKAEKLQKARKHLAEAEKLDLTSLDLWQSRANIALKVNSKSEMLQVAYSSMKALERNPWDFMPIAAELLIKGGDFKNAQTCIQKMKTKEIDASITNWLMGLLAEAQNQDYEAIKYWKKALNAGYNSEKATAKLVKALSRVGDNESALMILRKKTIEQPNSYIWHFELAKLLLQEQKYNEALEYTKRAMAILPNSIEPLIINIQAQIALPDKNPKSDKTETLKNISEKLTALTGLSSDYPESELLKFTCALESQDFDKAEEILTGLLKKQPGSLESQIAWVDLLLAKNKKDEAVLKLEELITEFPQNIEPVIYLSDLLIKFDKKQQSETLVLDALKRINDHISKRKLALHLSGIYIQTNEAEKTYLFLANLLKQMPFDIPIRKKLLELYIDEKQYHQAQKVVDEIKQIEGADGRQWKYEQAKLWCSDVYFDKYCHRIIDLLQQNINDNPDDNASRLLLASVYEKASQEQSALITYRQALNRYPYDMDIKTNMIDFLFKIKEYDTAGQLLNYAVQQDYINSDILKLNLKNLLRQSKISSAVEFLEGVSESLDDKRSVNLLLAWLKINQNEYEPARQILNDLLTQDPNSIQAGSLLVELNIRTNHYFEAMTLCDEMIANENKAAGYILRANTYAAIGKTDLAEKDFENALTIEPNNVAALESRGFFYQSMGKYEKAFNEMEKACQLMPSNTDTLKYMLGLIPHINNPFKLWKCQQLLNNALINKPKDPELLWYKARFLIAENKSSSLDDAENILEEITNENPSFPYGWLLLAEMNLNHSELGKAINIILQGLKRCPNEKSLLLLKARTEMLSAPDMAVLTLEHLYNLMPNDNEIIMQLSDAYISTGKSQKAIQMLTEYEQKCPSPQRKNISTALAFSLSKGGKEEESQQKLRQLSIAYPNDIDVSMTKIQIFHLRQNWNDLEKEFAILLRHHPEYADQSLQLIKKFLTSENQMPVEVSQRILTQFLKFHPQSTAALQMLAINLHINEQINPATECYVKLLEIDPNNIVAINNLAWILCEKQNNYYKAIELADYGLKLYPDYANLMDTRGLTYYRMGEYEKAFIDFQDSIKLNYQDSSSYVVSLFHLARTSNLMGDKKNTRDYMEKAVSLNERYGGLSRDDVFEAYKILNQLPDKLYEPKY